MAKFSIPLPEIRERVEVQLDGIYRKTALRLFNDIVDRTPIDQEGDDGGTARNSWQAYIGTPNNTGPLEADKSGSSAKASIEQKVSEFKTRSNNVIGLENGCGYIGMLDHGLYPNPSKAKKPKTIGGFSTQAPHGIVLVSLMKFRQFVSEARGVYGSK